MWRRPDSYEPTRTLRVEGEGGEEGEQSCPDWTKRLISDVSDLDTRT